MPIHSVEPADRAGFLDLVDAEIRPDRAKTNARDDFPIILGPENAQNQLVYKTDEGLIAGCIAYLIRDLKTSCGDVTVAGVGSVVTRPDFRGQGLSSALQNEMLRRLKGKNVPLAVLWTDQPEIYSGRGFKPGGWEIHLDLDELRSPTASDSQDHLRPYAPQDLPRIEEIHARHPWRTHRQAGESAAYYGMPGTRGFVAEDHSGVVQAYVFCGKGADFPGYILEWGGDLPDLVTLCTHARDGGLASQVLIPTGAEDIVNPLVDLGAAWRAENSGYWAVLDADHLARISGTPTGDIPPESGDPAFWLGDVDDEGLPIPGRLDLAVWGFDSV